MQLKVLPSCEAGALFGNIGRLENKSAEKKEKSRKGARKGQLRSSLYQLSLRNALRSRVVQQVKTRLVQQQFRIAAHFPPPTLNVPVITIDTEIFFRLSTLRPSFTLLPLVLIRLQPYRKRKKTSKERSAEK